MSNVLTIIKKEFSRFFRDRRLVIGTLLLPGLLIFVLYTLMGSVFADTSETYTAKVVNPSEVFAALVAPEGEDAAILLSEIEESDLDAAKAEVKNGGADLVIVFPEGFDQALAGGQTYPVGHAPNVEVWYDSGSASSSAAYNLVYSLLDRLENSLSNMFDINFAGGGDLVSAAEAEASYYAMLLPFLILTFLYSGCMGIAPESIAGEKERGTIATLLVTPVKRSELVMGKIASLSVLSALSAISSFIGTFLALPKLMGGSIGSAFASYSVGQYFALFAVMLSAVLIIVSLISIISSFAKSVKEAASLSVPLMVIVMLVGISTMLFTTHAHAAFLIPVYNCVQVMAEIFSMQFSWVNLAITLGSNLVYIVLLVWALTKMFKSEKVIFNS